MMRLHLIHVALRTYYCLTNMSIHCDTRMLSSLCAKHPLCLQALCCHEEPDVLVGDMGRFFTTYHQQHNVQALGIVTD